MVIAALLGSLSSNLGAARAQMGLSLGWHMILASMGVGFPWLVVGMEYWGRHRGDETALRLARRWTRTLAVLFAIGAVSGTILSFELGMLWPRFMGHFGAVFGFPFVLEGVAFFIEAIFLGIYVYCWDTLPVRLRTACGVPICLAGLASAFFVVSANSWMNSPTGFSVTASGKLTAVHPWAAIANPATFTETVHTILAAFMVTGFVVASVYAVAILRGRTDRYHRLGFVSSFAVGAIFTPLEGIMGDLSARYVAQYQPTKLAAMEVVLRTGRGVPETIGGLLVGGRIVGALQIPDGLSLLLRFNPHGLVQGLSAVPAADRPPVNIVHISFDLMVLMGFGLFGLALWGGWLGWRRRCLSVRRGFLRASALSGLASVVALESGWLTTEMGRLPWIVYGVMKVSKAVNPAPWLWVGFWVVLVLYTALTAELVFVLVRMNRSPKLTAERARPSLTEVAD